MAGIANPCVWGRHRVSRRRTGPIGEYGMMKRIVVGLVVILALFAGYLVLASALVSVDTARNRAISQFSAWSGREVTASDSAELGLFPAPSLVLRDLRVSGPDGDSDSAVLTAERVTADIRILPLLIGRISLSALTLDNAQIRLTRSADGKRNWEFDGAPAAVQLALTGGLPFDRVVLNNAALNYYDAVRDESESASLPSLTLDWENIRQPATLTGTIVARDEMLDFHTRVDYVPAFFNGNTTAVSAELTSELLNARLDGDLTDYKSVRFAGELDASGPSLRRIIAFFGGPETSGPGFGPVELSGHADLKPDKLFVDRGSIRLDDNSATGTLSIAMSANDTVPKVTGTLAFSTLNLTPYLEALDGGGDVGWRELRIDTDWFDNFDADVRLSADQITAGRYTFGNTAASAFLTDRLLEIGLAQAEFYKGTLSGNVSITDLRGDAGQTADIQLRATDFNLGETIRLAFDSPEFGGTATMSVDLETRGKSLGEQADALAGSLTLLSVDGGIPDFGMVAASDALAANTPLEGVSRGGVAFYQRLKLHGSIRNSQLVLETLLLEAKSYSASLNGTVNMADRMIELDGAIGSDGEGGRQGRLQISGPVSDPAVTLTPQ